MWRRLERRPLIVALIIGAILIIAIVAGSEGLRNFDAALIGYATASVFALAGVSYHFTQWLTRPPTHLYWRRGWQIFTSWENFRRYSLLVPAALIGNLAMQQFIWPRSPYRWFLHLMIFWGVVLSSVITFPLVFGWFRFRPIGVDRYQMIIAGGGTFTFDPHTVFAWFVFHALDVTAFMVILGVGMAIWRRWQDRAVQAEQEFGYDFVPLLLLLAISLTGWELTASSLLWRGQFYWFISLTHQALVILAILYIPFGKFWHVLQRPASVGVELYKQVHAEPQTASCGRCGREFHSPQFVGDLKETLRQLGQEYTLAPTGQSLHHFCPECKRVMRGNTYFKRVTGGFL